MITVEIILPGCLVMGKFFEKFESNDISYKKGERVKVEPYMIHSVLPASKRNFTIERQKN